MLCLSRKPGQTVTIGEAITVRLVKSTNGLAVLGIDAPADLPILRDDAKDRTPRHERGKDVA